MKIPYIKIPITDMYAYLAPCPAEIKGKILEAILSYGMYQTWPTLVLDPAQEQAYSIVKQLIEREIKSYQKFCKEQKEKIKKYWNKTKNTDDTTVLPPRNNQTKQELKQEQEAKQKLKQKPENINISTVPPALAQDRHVLSEVEKNPTKPRVKTKLQEFSNEVLKRFESHVQTDKQKGIWFKRNCRCLKDILEFCNEDIPLALQTISTCAQGLAKAGLWGGYEAVCRNLPEYYDRAQQELERQTYERSER